MRFLHPLIQAVLLVNAGVAFAASSWSFEDATLSIQTKGAGVGGGSKEKLSPTTPLSKPVSLGVADTLKVILTTTEGKKSKKPHQAFLALNDPTTGLEESYPFSVKDNGKAKVDLTHKDLPLQFVTSKESLTAYIVIGSFGSSAPLKSKSFNIKIDRDPNTPINAPEPPVRYGKRDEIHHIFRSNPKSPSKIITLVFAAAVLGAVVALFGVWTTLGANLNHLPKALSNAPIPHALFFGSILAIEATFFMYYTTWNLFQTLPAAAAVGAVAFLSGSRALSEVQERRLAGLR
ncbi:hypothetical protein M501DRAFT_931581 [Patellaria atrata CBS 101060]|uniref:Ribophorin II C-terminal domain-containing protein n=1 Tax=Patellaria atrata CBS 101060 TaxID=1346257 RepID=A0A9P4SD43_9PEZI|nr:hypothetical protein M501DRAFT_931581 [Patellaria atrata CBS 101060]